MKEYIPGNRKHLDLEDRIQIEKGLDAGLYLREIAENVRKNPTTISKEIRKHRAGPPPCLNISKQTRKPLVCNGCDSETECRLDRCYYRAAQAQRRYQAILSSSRAGLRISPEDKQILDRLVSPLILQGQSPFTILQNHPEISISEKTLYNYIDAGILSIGNADLPKKSRYRSRRAHRSENLAPEVLEGRRYKDFQDRVQACPDTQIVEMDTLLGIGGAKDSKHKVLLTFHFENCHFMMAFLLPSRSAEQVAALFNRVEYAVSTFVFLSSFPIVLTDRGKEFSRPDLLECGGASTIRTSIYYCDPMCSWQKPHCEKNHEYIRKICPRGTSFDHFLDSDIRLMMSHINSSPRRSLGGLTPLSLAEQMLPSALLDFFGLTKIPPDHVNLTPSLLKR